jgi:hypothetical protein
MDYERIIELFWQRSEDALIAAESRFGAYCRKIAANILRDGSGHHAHLLLQSQYTH